MGKGHAFFVICHNDKYNLRNTSEVRNGRNNYMTTGKASFPSLYSNLENN
jgi:hypothetical protein